MLDLWPRGERNQAQGRQCGRIVAVQVRRRVDVKAKADVEVMPKAGGFMQEENRQQQRGICSLLRHKFTEVAIVLSNAVLARFLQPTQGLMDR